jgi:hypothetical protein
VCTEKKPKSGQGDALIYMRVLLETEAFSQQLRHHSHCWTKIHFQAHLPRLLIYRTCVKEVRGLEVKLLRDRLQAANYLHDNSRKYTVPCNGHSISHLHKLYTLSVHYAS